MSDTHRLFVAVFPPRDMLRSLICLRERLEPEIPGLRWVASGNLHFTLRFFGDRTRDEGARAGEVLSEVVGRTEAFDLELSGVGVFPSWKRPRVLWVGSGTGSDRLVALAEDLERGFRDAGLGKADKRFVPHLTLGRWRDTRKLDLRGAQVAGDAVEEVGTFTVNQAGVIQSTLSPRGARYEPLYEAALRDRAEG